MPDPASPPLPAPGPPAGPGREAIHLHALRLWAHVGVLERERELGQWFELSLSLWHDLGPAGRSDDLRDSLDYSLAIRALQEQARTIRCLTLEHYAERMMECLEQLYGPVTQRLILTKCAAPVPGFSGLVQVERWRHRAPAG
ncbi:Dihydroneopterin aldolase [Synechococcus sp. CBW1107]|uniref:dihydroneopterin aldolase n=1 Tax=Synechococcus sp. CBW1107 TaxID=2789857 RepID=UPI002AD4D0A2|nr:dihydroneopterin aldolase [Synechococcus sp. CBW1107]CAK6698283.1 Dihydroneopterin aldolase [Synechococcus sp. CBW1107]